MAQTPTHLLRSTATTYRATNATDSGGSPTKSWASSLTGVKMDVQPMSGADAERYGADRTRRNFMLYWTPGIDITDDDVIQFTDATTGSNVTRNLRLYQPPSNAINMGVIVSAGAYEDEGVTIA
jgi:hypothetical protein